MKNDKWFLIINPQAGGGKGRKHWPSIQKLLKHTGIEHEHAFSKYRGEAIEIAQKAVEEGFRKLVAVGGDGTANEVINGMFLQEEVPPESLIFAIIPVGTGNDWIKTHGIPNNYKKSILLMRAGITLVHDIGKIIYHNKEGEAQTRYFLNVAGLAYDAFVTKASQENNRWGHSAMYYLYLIVRSVTKFKPTNVTINFDGQQMEHPFYNITIGQCQYNGGGTRLVPQADPRDGQFALTLFKDISPWEVVFKAPQFYSGSVVKHKEAFVTQAKHILIQASEDKPAFVEADGEFLGQTPVEFIMLPKAVQVIVP